MGKQQKISGEFDLDINATNLNEFKPLEVLEALKAINGLQNVEKVCATLLGIMLLTTKFQAKQGQWILMKGKSEKYLKKQMKNVSESVTDLLNLFQIPI